MTDPTIEAVSIGYAIRQEFIRDIQIKDLKRRLRKLRRIILIKLPTKLIKALFIALFAIYLKHLS